MKVYCTVCLKEIKRGLYNDPSATLCSASCAAWFGRAVMGAVFLPGDDYRRIENWLREYKEVQRKRNAVPKSKREPVDCSNPLMS